MPAKVVDPLKEDSRGCTFPQRSLPYLQASPLEVWLSDFSFLELSLFHWLRMASPQSSTYHLDILKVKRLI